MISRMTAWTIQANDVQIVDTPERSECWILKNGAPHALMLSCPLDKRNEMEALVKELKEEVTSPVNFT